MPVRYTNEKAYFVMAAIYVCAAHYKNKQIKKHVRAKLQRQQIKKSLV